MSWRRTPKTGPTANQRPCGWQRHPQRGGAPDQSGFVFIEVVVASVILLMAMIAVGSQLGTQFLSVSTSSDQQEATDLLNQTMEEVRALPYSFVQTGLSLTADQTLAEDNNIDKNWSNSTCTTDNSAIWPTPEVIPCAATASQAQAPFDPHISSTTHAGVTFSVATYPSIDAADTGSSPYIVYRVTIIVTWTSTQPGPKQLVGQTLVFSPASVSGDCLSSNHPFNAPCQPFLYSSAVAGGGYIDIIPDPTTTNQTISGDPFNSAELTFPLTSFDSQIEQVSSVFGSTTTSGGTISATTQQAVGASTVSASADNDPGTSRPTWDYGPVSQSCGSPCSVELPANPAAGANWISVGPGSGDSGKELATADANTSNPYPCNDLLANQIETNLPCGSSNVSQSGSAGSVSMGLYAGGVSLGTAPLGSVAAQPSTYPDETFVSRFDPPTSPTPSLYCSSTPSDSDGCVHAGAQESLGTIELGGLPAQFLTDGAAPAGWGAGTGACPSGSGNNNYLLAMVDYSAGVSSESGVDPGASALSVPVSTSAPTPTLCYWSGSGYSTLSVNWGGTSGATAPTPPANSPPAVSVTDSRISSGAVTVSIAPTVQLVGDSTAQPGGTCSSVCTGSADVPSLVEASITYVVTQGSTTLADFVISMSLGEVYAKTSYQTSPQEAS